MSICSFGPFRLDLAAGQLIAPVGIDTAATVTPGLTVVPAGPASGLITVPETHYARSGDVNIA